MTASLARLVFPALRWRRESFAHERAKIDAALAAGVGGFIVFGGTRDAVAALAAALRQQAGHPLLIGADLERGPAQQVEGLTELPPPAALGWLDDLEATATAGIVTGTEARAVGINWAFAPVCDLDLEPRNPIVQTRSFGVDPVRVGEHAAVWIRGLAYPAWDATGRAASFSPAILGYLRDTLNFAGLVVTDALIMAGASAAQPVPAATVTAVAAGCDALLYPEDFAGVAAALDRAVGGEISAARADEALGHYDETLAAWGDLPDQGEPDLAAHGAFADGLADRVAHLVRGDAPMIRAPLAVSIVDDDVGGPYTVGPRDVFVQALRQAGVTIGHRATGNVKRIILVYAEPRSWKGRASLGARSLAQLRRLAPGAELVVLFAHPRLAAQIPGRAPILCCWHGQPLMQRGAARWVLARVQ